MKLSNILFILTLAQGIWTVGLSFDWWAGNNFNIQHEDYIFIAHMMTWFIVRSIENIDIFKIENITVQSEKEDKNENNE